MVDEQDLVADRRLLLEVPPGKRGLRQAEAVFQHVRNLPKLLGEILPLDEVEAVAVSNAPRSLEGSYMPVFKTGEAFAHSLALAWDVPCYFTSHQAGHIWAGLCGENLTWDGEFLALHISGGTTDLLSVTLDQATADMTIAQIGGSLDINAGQLIDRVGVKMGFAFPCGPRLEELAQSGRQAGIPATKLPVSIKGLGLNLSGPEAAATRALEAGVDPRALAQGVEECLAESMAALISHGTSSMGLDRVLVVGGVAANRHIRAFLSQALRAQGVMVTFTSPRLSSDNAVGIAAYGLWRSRLF